MKATTKELNKNAIVRCASWYRPYNVNGKTIEKVFVYFNGKVLYESQSAWLEHNGQDITEICGIHEVLNRRKIKLDGKHFTLRSKVNSLVKEARYDLYICARVEKLGERLKNDYSLNKLYVTDYTIYLSGVYGKPALDENKELIYNDEITPVINCYSNLRWETTEKGNKVKDVQNILKSVGMKNVSHYDVEKLLESYDIVKKVV